MEKVKIGCIGGARGKDLFKYLIDDESATLVAVCDFRQDVLDDLTEFFKNKKCDVKLIRSYDELLKLDIDAVVLANYATEHAPFAIKALKSGKHVLSEVLPAFNLKECVELIEAVEETGKIYAYSENYCYLDVAREMKRLVSAGLLGEIEYAEGEYVHDCEPIWPSITYGERDHWRNKKHAFYYCTHSCGPIIHSTGLRPVSVVGFEGKYNAKMRREGALAAPFAVEMITLSNGAIMRSTHGQMNGESVWYSLRGSDGAVEGERRASGDCDSKRKYSIYSSLNTEIGKGCPGTDRYTVKNRYGQKEYNGHELADRYAVDEFVRALKGEQADIIGIYEAIDMFLIGVFAYKSVLACGVPMQIPDLRDKAQREIWRKDVSCVDESIAGDQVIPSYSKGNAVIEQEIYDGIKKEYLRRRKESEKNK